MNLSTSTTSLFFFSLQELSHSFDKNNGKPTFILHYRPRSGEIWCCRNDCMCAYTEKQQQMLVELN